jgi:hypothetical protein
LPESLKEPVEWLKVIELPVTWEYNEDKPALICELSK